MVDRTHDNADLADEQSDYARGMRERPRDADRPDFARGQRTEPRWYGDYDTFSADFHNHFETTYSDNDYDYERYAPGYRYGYNLAVDPRYQQYKEWEDVEPLAREQWSHERSHEHEQEGTWEEIKEAARSAWYQVKNLFGGDYERYEPRFQRHYEATSGRSDADYERYAPGYRYGYLLAMNPEYRETDRWEDVEPYAREHWPGEQESTWDQVKDSARHAWEEVKAAFGSYDEYESDFRRHYETTYGENGRDYADYEPGYRYGYRLATNPRYRLYEDWMTLEPYARREWARDHDESTWDEIKDGVRHAWEAVKDAFDGDDRDRATSSGTWTSRTVADSEAASSTADRTIRTPDVTTPVTDVESDFDRFDPDFRTHFHSSFAQSPYAYDEVQPAYRYGYDLARDAGYADRSWDEMEPVARSRWEAEHDGVWDEVKDAVRYGWARVKAAVS